jgi:hypothetical protein
MQSVAKRSSAKRRLPLSIDVGLVASQLCLLD